MLDINIAKVMCLKWTLINADLALVGGAALYGICRRGRWWQWLNYSNGDLELHSCRTLPTLQKKQLRHFFINFKLTKIMHI